MTRQMCVNPNGVRSIGRASARQRRKFEFVFSPHLIYNSGYHKDVAHTKINSH